MLMHDLLNVIDQTHVLEVDKESLLKTNQAIRDGLGFMPLK